MSDFFKTVRDLCSSFYKHRELIYSLTKREIAARYRGSFLGALWAVITPVLMLLVYTFVFSVIFKSKWSQGSESKLEFAMVLFIGLLVFNLFSEVLTRSTTLITGNVNYVKKIVFPLEVLSMINVASAAFNFLIGLGVWLVAYVFLFGVPHLTFLLIPLIIFPYILFLIGLSLIFSSLGVYVRDTGQIVSILVSVLIFVSPVFYPASSLPEGLRGIFMMNPITPVIESIRDVAYWGNHLGINLIRVYLLSLITLVLGFAWFQKTRKGFSDVI